MSAVRYLFDEDFNDRVVRGFRRQRPAVDAVRVYDVGLTEAEDTHVIEWAARHRRVVVSHDRRTMSRFARERIAARLPIARLILVHQDRPIGAAIEDLVLISGLVAAEELRDMILFLPL